ncbi:toxin-antitoxin system TumE family protein [Magnetococcales bacterium HHB-1]
MHDGYWYKIEAQKVKITPQRPHGIRYSLTLHTKRGERIFGIDNAHPVSMK